MAKAQAGIKSWPIRRSLPQTCHYDPAMVVIAGRETHLVLLLDYLWKESYEGEMPVTFRAYDFLGSSTRVTRQLIL